MSSPRARRIVRRRVVPGVEPLETRINQSKLTLLPASLPGLTLGQDYQADFSTTNGNGHYTYSVTSGKLPKGLALGKNGILSGDPALAASYRFTVKVVEAGRGRASGTRTFSLTVSAGPATVVDSAPELIVSTPATASAGTGFNVTVTAENAAGGIVTNFSGDATLTSSDGQPVYLSSPLVFENGTAVANVTLDTAGTVTLTAAAGLIRGTSGSITNSPAAVAGLVVQAPSAATAGAGFPVTVTALDQYGNTVAGFDGSVALTGSDGQSVDLFSPLDFHDGTAMTTVALYRADTVALTAVAGAIHGVSGLVVNSPAAVATFDVSAPATATAGSAFAVTVTAEDAFANTVTAWSGGVTLLSSDGQPVELASPWAFHDGTAVASVTLDTAATVTLTAASGAIHGTSSSIAVSSAAASRFVVDAPSTATAGSAFSVTVTAEDAFGNPVSGFGGEVTLACSDQQPVDIVSPLEFSNGTATTSVILDTAAMVTLTATAGTVHGTCGPITNVPTAMAGFLVDAPNTATAGVPFAVTLTAVDAYGNPVTDFTGSVTLSAGDGQALNLQAPLVVSDGVGSAMITLDTADTLTLRAAFGTFEGTSGIINDAPGPASQLIVSAPSTATTGSGFTVTVTAEDAFDNTATGFNGLVTLSASDRQPLNLLGTVTLTDGTAVVVVTLDFADSVTVSGSSGMIDGSSAAILVSAPVATDDWFSQNMPDVGLQDLARTDYARDGSLTYSDMLGLFAAAEGAGSLTDAELQSLQDLVTAGGAAAVNMSSVVQSLTYKVVDGDPANSLYLGNPLGDLEMGSSATQLTDLVEKWFLGADHPAIDMEYLSIAPPIYTPAAGTLFGSGGPSYKDVDQGAEGDCWLLASYAETAALEPAGVTSMFTDLGTATDNGVQVHVWAVRFYDNGVPTYLTVDNELPADSGELVYDGEGQSVSNSSNVLWVPLLEKAYAQLCASGWNGRPVWNAYSSLNSGSASTALPVITGDTGSDADAFDSESEFIGAISSGTLLTLASFTNNSPSEVNALGIVSDHDYAVLGYDASTGTFTLLNPWGWNNSSAPGILTLTWQEIVANFDLDGDSTQVSSS